MYFRYNSNFNLIRSHRIIKLDLLSPLATYDAKKWEWYFSLHFCMLKKKKEKYFKLKKIFKVEKSGSEYA